MIETKKQLKDLLRPLPDNLVRIIAHKEMKEKYDGGYSRDESKEVTFIVECTPDNLEKTISTLLSKGFNVTK